MFKSKILHTLIALTCGAVAFPVDHALAQNGVGNTKSFRSTGAFENDRVSRIIIKFKTPNSERSISQRFDPEGKARVQSLSERLPGGVQQGEANLRYLKSIHNNIQVVSTQAPLSRANMRAFLTELAADPDVEYAEIDEKAFAHMTPNDSLYGQMWNLKAPAEQTGGANFQLAWDRVIGANTPVSGAGVIVAVVDTGYRPHADLMANVLQGYDFIAEDSLNVFTTANDGDGRDADATDPGDWNPVTINGCDREDSSWHGTHVAGTISALGNNSAGVIGGAFGAKILPVRVLGVCGGYSSDIQEGMYWAAGLLQVNGVTNPNIAKVINLSLGSISSCSASYQNAVTAVINAGTTVVVSTGNDFSSTTISSPANCNGVIAVTAHTSTGYKADYANVGNGTTISAPGSGIYSTANTGTTAPLSDAIRLKSGTSMAAPHVAAAAALLLQIKPTLTPAQIKSLLMTNARAFPGGSTCASVTTCGSGLLDAFAAVKALQVSEGATANTAPSMTSSANQSGTVGVSLQIDLTAIDAEGDAITFSNSNLPSGASLDSNTGRLSWSNPVLGNYSFTVTPSDTSRSGTSQTVSLNVSAASTSGGGGGGGSINLWELALICLFGTAAFLFQRRSAQQ